jgi:hypothetical protein
MNPSDSKRSTHRAFRRQSLSEILENEKNQRRVVPSSAPASPKSEDGPKRTESVEEERE